MIERTYSYPEMGHEHCQYHSSYYRIEESGDLRGSIIKITRFVGETTGRVVFDESRVLYTHARYLTEGQKDEMIRLLEERAETEDIPAVVMSAKIYSDRLSEEEHRIYLLQIEQTQCLEDIERKKIQLTD